MTTRGGHGLVNDGESAQAQALLVEDLHDGGDVRAAYTETLADYDREVTEYYDLRSGSRLESFTHLVATNIGVGGAHVSWSGWPMSRPTIGKVSSGSSSAFTIARGSARIEPR